MFLSLLAIVVSLRPWHRLHEECTTMALEVATQRHKSHPTVALYDPNTIPWNREGFVWLGVSLTTKIHCELYQNEGNLEFPCSFKGSRIFKKRASNVYRKKWDFKKWYCTFQPSKLLTDGWSVNQPASMNNSTYEDLQLMMAYFRVCTVGI